MSKRVRDAHLWAKQIKAGVRIGLSAVGEMLVKRAHLQFPLIIHHGRNTRCRKNVEREILALGPGNIRVAVDPPPAYSAGYVRREPAAPWHKVVAKAEIKSEIVVLDSAKDRLCHRAHVKLMVTAQPCLMDPSPTNSCGHELRANFVAGRGVDRA